MILMNSMSWSSNIINSLYAESIYRCSDAKYVIRNQTAKKSDTELKKNPKKNPKKNSKKGENFEIFKRRKS